MVRKNLSLLLLISLFGAQMLADDSSSCDTLKSKCCETGSKTFFRPRSFIEDVTFILALNNYNIYRNYYAPFDNNSDDQRINIAKGIFYQKSRNNEHKVAEYFLPNNKKCITIKETGPADIDSLWLEVMAPVGSSYSSVLTMDPKRSMFGGYLSYHQQFQCLMGSWFEANFAVYEVKHNLRAKETLSGPKGIIPNAATALQYLDSDNLVYGKISPCNLENRGFDDIQLKLGYDYFNCVGDRHLGLYAQAIVPIADKPNARHLFEPLIGRAHWGVGLGLNTACKVMEKENKSLVFMADVSWQYLFKAREKRSFDLTANGDWSRFLLGTTRTPGQIFPLINSLTQTVQVTPRNTVNFWTGLHFQKCRLHVEAGYNLWYRQCEKLRLNESICSGNSCNSPVSVNNSGIQPFGTFGIFGLGNVCVPITASNASINQPRVDVVSNSVFVPVTINELNLTSAAQPRIITNKFYGSLAYDFNLCERSINMGLTGSYEFSHNKNALDQWGIAWNINAEF